MHISIAQPCAAPIRITPSIHPEDADLRTTIATTTTHSFTIRPRLAILVTTDELDALLDMT